MCPYVTLLLPYFGKAPLVRFSKAFILRVNLEMISFGKMVSLNGTVTFGGLAGGLITVHYEYDYVLLLQVAGQF